MPKLSIMVLVYNHEKYLRKCLDGIFNQIVNFDYEVVIGEDCSTDSSRSICLEYKEKYPDVIKLVLQDKNKGLIGNYIDICNVMTGEYEACIAGDDYWIDANKLQMQVDFLDKNPDIGLCYTNVITCNDEGLENTKPLIDSLFMPTTFEGQLFKTCYMAPNTWVCRRDLKNRICEQKMWFTDESLATALDFLFHSKMVMLDKVTTVYRVRSNSLANQTDAQKKWKYEKGILKMQLYYAKKYNCTNEIIDKLYFQEYPNKIFSALEANDTKFVDEMLEFYRNHGMEMKWFVEYSDTYIMFKNKYFRLLYSKPYKLGKFILSPLKKIISIFYGKR